MLQKINTFLSGIGPTLVDGVFLLFSFALSRLVMHIPVDTAWLTVVISGLPLLYWSSGE